MPLTLAMLDELEKSDGVAVTGLLALVRADIRDRERVEGRRRNRNAAKQKRWRERHPVTRYDEPRPPLSQASPADEQRLQPIAVAELPPAPAKVFDIPAHLKRDPPPVPQADPEAA